MALSDRLYLYVRLEHLMMDLDDRGDPLADKVRGLLDPLWYSLSGEERQSLDGRGAIEVRVMYPVTLVVPDLFHEPPAEHAAYVDVLPENGVGKRFPLGDDVLCAA